jgi:hypothetical protein
MKRFYPLSIVLLFLLSFSLPAAAQDQSLAVDGSVGTAFTYQGRLSDAGTPANGDYDLQFNLYNDSAGGSSLGQVKINGVPVSDGLFAVLLDFGSNAFNGDERWLEIAVRPGSGGSYTTVSPRQLHSPAPYAIYASTAPWSGLDGVPPGLNDGDDDTLGGLSCANGQVTQWNGSAWVCAGGGSGWSLSGNTGTNPGTHFLGTSDNKALEIKVNGDRAFRLEPNDYSPRLVGGHESNEVQSGAAGATIGGGGNSDYPQKVTDTYGTVGGGAYNQAGNGSSNVGDAPFATVGGGWHNVASGPRSTIAGGNENEASGDYTAVGGGIGNDAAAYAATVGGGMGNAASAAFATVGGGGRSDISKPETGNDATDRWTTVGGGARNLAGNGNSNTTDAEYATVGGGYWNTANGRQATVAGGADNMASYRATIAGGLTNRALGGYSAIPGGYLNTTLGSYAFAAGQRAKANHEGTFVWADSTTEDFASSKADEFAVRASGGVRFQTNGGLAVENSSGQDLFAVDSSGKLTAGTLTNNELSFTLTYFQIVAEDTDIGGELPGEFNVCMLAGYYGLAKGALDEDIGMTLCHVWPGGHDWEGDWTGPGEWWYQIKTDEYQVCHFVCF